MCVFCWQAEAATDEVYAQVSLVPQSEVGFILVSRFVWLMVAYKNSNHNNIYSV